MGNIINYNFYVFAIKKKSKSMCEMKVSLVLFGCVCFTGDGSAGTEADRKQEH